MSDTYVFDTEAIIAYLYDEPGRDVVEAYLTEVRDGSVEGLIAETNAAELFYLIAQAEGVDDGPTPDSFRTADRDVRALQRWGVELKRASWRMAGEVKSDGHISLANAHAVGLAAETDGTLIAGRDDDFDSLSIDVDVVRFRDGSV